jgi:hypothetical protein
VEWIKCQNTSLVSARPLNSPSTKKKKKKKKTKILESNQIKTQLTNLWDMAKAMLRGKFITVSAYIKKSERSQINSLIMHLKLLGK